MSGVNGGTARTVPSDSRQWHVGNQKLLEQVGATSLVAA